MKPGGMNDNDFLRLALSLNVAADSSPWASRTFESAAESLRPLLPMARAIETWSPSSNRPPSLNNSQKSSLLLSLVEDG